MGFACIIQTVCALKSTSIGILVVSPFLLPLCTSAGAQTSPKLSKDQQQRLYDPDIETPLSLAKNVVEVPLQRKLIDEHGRFYFLNVSIGSPVQSLEVLLDTGSTDTWVYDNTYCEGNPNSRYQCYNSNHSITSHVIPPPPSFEALYPHLKFQGLYVIDNFDLSTAKIKSAEFGMVNQGSGPDGGGIMGLGFDTAEFGPNKTFSYIYPDILDTLYNESIIDSRSFGLYLNNGSVIDSDAKGSLVLGGYDKSKFTEPLASFSIQSPNDVQRIGVPLASISAVIAGEPVPIWSAALDRNVRAPWVPAVLDSGDMMAQIPVNAHNDLVERLNKYKPGMLTKPKPKQEFDPCMECKYSSSEITINFTFASSTIAITFDVPFSELVLPSPFGSGKCWFALRPKPIAANKPYWLNLGSSIVDSMYLIVDYDKDSVQIAKARYDGQAAEIVPINHRSRQSS